MTDDVPQILLGLGDASEYIVMIGEEEAEVNTLAKLLTFAPALKEPEGAAEAARAINYLSQGAAFRVIEDPATFEAQYRATLASEDTSAPWAEGVIRLSDYGVPDFTTIAAPQTSAARLVFYAVDDLLGLPYRVELDLSAADLKVTDDDYKALDLEPIEFDEPQEMPKSVDLETDPLAKMMATKPSD